MKKLLCVLTFAALAGACGSKPLAPQREITEAEMIASAREHLPWFLERLAAADSADSGFRLIARMPAEGGRAAPDIAMQDIVVEGDTFVGTVVKTKADWPEYAAGKSLRFASGVVVDWSFVHGERSIGGFRLRAQMCKAGQMLESFRAKTADAQKALTDLQDSMKEYNACAPYDPRADYATGSGTALLQVVQ